MESGTAIVRRSRRDRGCDARNPGCAGIQRGDRYVRSVSFPGSLFNDGPAPSVTTLCEPCARLFTDLCAVLDGTSTRSQDRPPRPPWPKHRTLTQAELVAEAKARFGNDPAQWAFTCPACGDTATGRDFRDALAAHPRTRKGEPVVASDLLGQECIGRVLGALRVPANEYRGRGCDWCAFGLISGPWAVVQPDGRKIPCFPLAQGG
jgi:hypothetical protein